MWSLPFRYSHKHFAYSYMSHLLHACNLPHLSYPPPFEHAIHVQ